MGASRAEQGRGATVRAGANTPEAHRRPGGERTFRRYIERREDEEFDARADKRMHRIPAHRRRWTRGSSDPSELPERTVPDAKSETDQAPPNHH